MWLRNLLLMGTISRKYTLCTISAALCASLSYFLFVLLCSALALNSLIKVVLYRFSVCIRKNIALQIESPVVQTPFKICLNVYPFARVFLRWTSRYFVPEVRS
jgi:hypothetical protein